MQRTTITLDDDLDVRVDQFRVERGYGNRSEAIRDLVRAGLERDVLEGSPDKPCVAAAVYVYDHEARDLARRLTGIGHDHHDLSLATLHVHLDHESCLEITVLRGRSGDVRHYADHVIAERGVRYGRLVSVPVDLATESHAHGERPSRHSHVHVRRRPPENDPGRRKP
jgi:CopG family nickel-responsive transcriptional regulator